MKRKKTGAVSENVPGVDPVTGVISHGGLFNGKCIGTVLSGSVSDVSEGRHYAGRTEDDAGQSRE